jgi:hypothetical protein
VKHVPYNECSQYLWLVESICTSQLVHSCYFICNKMYTWYT